MITDGKTLYALIENGNGAALNKELSGMPPADLLNFMKWQNPDDNNNTPLHAAFDAPNADVIKIIAGILTAIDLSHLVDIQNDGGIIPIAKVLQAGTEAAKNFKTIMDAFAPDQKLALLTGRDYNQDTLLHNLAAQYEDEGVADLFDKVLEVINALPSGAFASLYRLRNVQDDMPAHTATIAGQKEFLEKTFAAAQLNSVLDGILTSKGENANTIVHLGFDCENPEISVLIVNTLATTTLDSVVVLNTENSGNLRPVEKWLEDSSTVTENNAIVNKAVNILNEVSAVGKQALIQSIAKYVSVSPVASLQLKTNIGEIYKAIKDDNTFVSMLLNAVDLTKGPLVLVDYWTDDAITARLVAVEQEETEVVNGATYAIDINHAYHKIDNYSTKYPGILPQGFGTIIKSAITAWLTNSTSEVINALAQAQEADLVSNYNNAKPWIYSICSSVDFKPTDLQADSETALQSAASARALTFVTETCKDIGKATDTRAAATKCLDQIKAFEGAGLGTFGAQKAEAERYATITQKEAEIALNYLFLYAKDQAVLKAITLCSLHQQDATKFGLCARELKTFMMNIKSGLGDEIGTKKISGFGSVYHQDSIGKLSNIGPVESKITNSQAFEARIKDNAKKLFEGVITALHLSGQPDDADVLKEFKARVCDDTSFNGAIEQTLAYQTMCDASFDFDTYCAGILQDITNGANL